MTDNCCFSFWAIFCPFSPLTVQKIKNKKNEKSAWRYHHFTYVYEKLRLVDVGFLRNGVQQTDGWTDGWTDKTSDT